MTITALLWSLAAAAADAAAADPAGTWKIATVNPETKKKGPERTLKLKLEAGKLTGTIDGRSEINGKVKTYEWAIKDGKIEGQEISFTVTHAPTVGQGEVTSTYKAKITGDSISGTVETEWGGNSATRGFDGRRIKE